MSLASRCRSLRTLHLTVDATQSTTIPRAPDGTANHPSQPASWVLPGVGSCTRTIFPGRGISNSMGFQILRASLQELRCQYLFAISTGGSTFTTNGASELPLRQFG
ncbi:hypothetical protein BDR06DRAFT_964176 [Suillus hirtellus]|nr:hypothetical protein BDR06DRAFT_964176 [Suillus hirtellus]